MEQAPHAQQRCGTCKQSKPLDEFSPTNRGRTGTWCRGCQREYRRTGVRPSVPNPIVFCSWCKAPFSPRTLKANNYCSAECLKLGKADNRRNAPKTLVVGTTRMVRCADCPAEFAWVVTAGLPPMRCVACKGLAGKAKKRRFYENNPEAVERERLQRNARYPKRAPELRSAARRRKYGVTEEWYEERTAKGCEICGAKTPGGKGSFHVDHDHVTQQVRGVLCHGCNVGIGSLQDDPEIIAKALKYVTKHRQMVLKV